MNIIDDDCVQVAPRIIQPKSYFCRRSAVEYAVGWLRFATFRVEREFMLLDQNEVKEVIDNRFLLDAFDMTLIRRANPEDSFRGPGFVRQTPEGKIEYTIYDQMRTSDFPERLSGSIREIIPEDEFYDLEMRDSRGRTWRGKQTLPATHGVLAKKGVVCRGELFEIQCYEETSSDNGLWLFLPGEFTIPANTGTYTVERRLEHESHKYDPNIWVIKSERYKIVIRKVIDGIEVDVTPIESSLPEYFDMRLEEAFWFTLSLPVQWKLIEAQNNGTRRFGIRSSRRNFPSPRLNPPLELRLSDNAEHIGNILIRYLEYVSPYTKPLYHPISAIIRRTLLSSAISIEAEAIALGIAIESVVTREFSSFGTPKLDIITSLDSAIAHINTWTGDDGIRDRVIKAISGWKGVNAREVLKQLVENGVIAEQHRAAWNAIRHRMVHGQKGNMSLDELLHQCDLTYMGLIRIMFKVLNYEGPYTDRSLGDWPTVSTN